MLWSGCRPGLIDQFLKILNGDLYAGNTKGEVGIISPGKIQTLKIGDTHLYDVVACKRNILVSTSSHIFNLDTRTENRNEVVPYCYYHLTCLGDTVIGSTRRTINYVVKGKMIKGLYYDHRIETIEIFAGKLWVGSDDGIYALDPGFKTQSKKANKIVVYDTTKFVRPEFLEISKGSDVVKIAKDGRNGLWFCTKGTGLFYLFNGVLKRFTSKEGLPDDIINDIFINADGTALLSCNSGAYLIYGLLGQHASWKFKKVYSGAIKNGVVFNDQIYLAGAEGLMILRYGNSMSGREKVHFNLAGIKIDTADVNPGSFSQLNADQKTVEFKFDIIDFSNTRPGLMYKITGALIDSGYTINPSLKFVGLNRGNYTLTVYPDVPNGKQAAIRKEFYVTGPFWQSPLFYAFCIVGSLGLFWLVTWLIIRNKKKKEGIRLKNEQLLLEYKLIALKAQVNPHFMSNCLSAIQDLVVNENQERALFYISEFGWLMRQILEVSSKQIIPLERELEMLETYLLLEQLRFENKFEYRIITEEPVSLKENFVPPLILNPIVENAIWHGLLPVQKLRKSMLLIRISQEEGRLKLEVEDNGVGIGNAKKKMSNNEGKSLGIQITEQRLQNINYLGNTLHAGMIVTGLMDEEHASAGTRVTLFLPLHLSELQNDRNQYYNN